MIRFFIFLLILCLPACGGGQKSISSKHTMHETVINPTDAMLHASLQNFFKSHNHPTFTQYQYVRYDLNEDGRDDALVYFNQPYNYWCVRYGCRFGVFQAHNTGFTEISIIDPIHSPVLISTQKINGWHSLVTRVSGRWSDTKNVTLLFDGKTYPTSPQNLNGDTNQGRFNSQSQGTIIFR